MAELSFVPVVITRVADCAPAWLTSFCMLASTLAMVGERTVKRVMSEVALRGMWSQPGRMAHVC